MNISKAFDSVYCPNIVDYVCGKDNETYLNSCYAEVVSISVAYQGKCIKKEISSEDSENDLEKDCPTFMYEICGKDGITYQNSCFLKKAKTEVNHWGICLPEESKVGEFDTFFYRRQFGLDFDLVENVGPRISIIGTIEPLDDGLLIVGTTQPGLEVNIYINHFIWYSTDSDQNGNWQIEIKHSEITQEKGVALKYLIEATVRALEPIKGVITGESKRIKIGELNVRIPESSEKSIELFFGGGIEKFLVSDEEIVGLSKWIGKENAKNFLTNYKVYKVIIQDIYYLILDNEKLIQWILIFLAIYIIFVDPIINIYLVYSHILVEEFLNWINRGFRRRKKGNISGVVYNAISKQRVSLVIVGLFETGFGKNREDILLETLVTDKFGRFDFDVPSGEYLIEVIKPNFSFPSQIVNSKLKNDNGYKDLYFQKNINLKNSSQKINFSIPLDPELKQFHADRPLTLNLIYQIWISMNYSATPVLIIFYLCSLLIFLIHISWFNFLILIIYMMVGIIHLKLTPKFIPSWGTVFNSKNLKPLQLANISLVDKKTKKVVSNRLSDYEGNYSFEVDKGTYLLKVSKKGYKSFKSSNKEIYSRGNMTYKNCYVGEPIDIISKNQKVKIDIPVDEK